jgi:hypothetical protein
MKDDRAMSGSIDRTQRNVDGFPVAQRVAM